MKCLKNLKILFLSLIAFSYSCSDNADDQSTNQNQTVADLIAALDQFEKMDFYPQNIRQAATRFDESVFQNKMRDFVRSVM